MGLLFWTLVAIPLLIATLAGVVFLVRGIRGSVTDDHPLCRRCGFDLVGLPSGVTACSECGADVSHPGAVRIGHRKRHRSLIISGGLLILPFVVIASLWSVTKFSSIQWIQYSPFWYLKQQAQSTVAAERNPAMAEISRRMNSGDLADNQIQELIDLALAHQADTSVTWISWWGDWIESARSAGKLPDEKWKQYMTAGPRYKLVARSQVRRGEKLPLRIEELPARLGFGSRSSFWVEVRYAVLPGGLAPAKDEPGSTGSSISVNSMGSSTRVIDLDPKLVAAASDGPQALPIRLKLRIFQANSTESRPPDVAPEIDLSAPFALVAADAVTVKPIDDPSLLPAMQKAIKVEQIDLSSPGSLGVSLSLQKLPAPVAYQVIVISGGREWPLSSINLPAGKSTNWRTGGNGKEFDADVADVILRPDPRTALNSVDLANYWNHELLYKDVKVTRPKR